MMSTNAAAPGKPKRRRAAIKPVHPILDHTLTAAYLGSCAWFLYVLVAADDRSSLIAFFAYVLGAAIGIKVVKYIFEILGRFVSARLPSRLGDPLKNPLAMRKWCDQSWQLAIHVSMTIAEIYVMHGETWWEDTKECWRPYPALQYVKPSLKHLYLIQLAIWVYTAFSHRFIEARRKDYVVMFVHHIATIILVGGSYVSSNLRIGLLILYIHDVSDIAIDSLKMSNYLKLVGASGWYVAEVLFVVNLAGWIYFRLYLFPFHLLNSSFFEAHDLGSVAGFVGQYFTHMPEHVPFWAVANVCLALLAVLHVYWFLLLLRIVKKAVAKPDQDAWRQAGASEYEGDSDDDDDDDALPADSKSD